MSDKQKTQAMIYAAVSKLAYDTVHEVMRQGEADGKSGWEERGSHDSIDHGGQHLHYAFVGWPTPHDDEHIRHALTRCAMAYYLWLQEQQEQAE